MIAAHQISAISFEQETLCLSIDGKDHVLPLEKISKKLKDASEVERNFFKVSPSGYGIHWPLIDEDLAVDALLDPRNAAGSRNSTGQINQEKNAG